MIKDYLRFNKYLLLFLLSVFCLLVFNLSYANILDNWNDPRAYKPRPVLFLHGFGTGSPKTWQSTITVLSKWFSKYQTLGYYLETIDFQDPIGSIDTYPDNRDGWADKLNYKINDLIASNKYGVYTNKLNLVGHSMGGLAGREYLTNSKYPSGYVDKLILVGTPNLGSPLTSIGKGIVTTSKIGTMLALSLTISLFSFRNDIDAIAKYIWISDTSEAFQDMTPDSSFLNILNSRVQPSQVEYYGIYGIIGHFLNRFYFGDWYGGDGVVRKSSQLGEDHILFKDTPYEIKAFHTNEPAVSVAGDNPLLKFLDSTTPELEITEPDPGQTLEIHQTSTHLKAKVYKEYLPADSSLLIKITREEDSLLVLDEQRPNSIKPSDLWIPNNPDSPVAELDEEINFPSKGTYTITCSVRNPAGLLSEPKTTKVKVTINKPVITDVSPTGVITERRPVISARIYSEDKVSIDLSSIQVKLDGSLVSHTNSPSEAADNIIITYTPSSGLTPTQHTVTIEAKDTNGLSADTKTWSFEIAEHYEVAKIKPTFPPCGFLWKRASHSYEEIANAILRINTSSGAFVGQDNIKGYHVFRSFLSFDTSALSGKQIISAKLLFFMGAAELPYTQHPWTDFHLETYFSNWLDVLGVDDWNNYTDLIKSVLIKKPPHNCGIWITIDYGPSIVNTQGKTQLVLISDRERLSIEPTTLEAIVITGNSFKLIVEYR